MDNSVYEKLGNKTEQLYTKLDHMQKEGWQSQLTQQLKEAEERILKLSALYERVEKGSRLQEQYQEVQTLWSEYRAFVKEANDRFQILVKGSESTGQFSFGFYRKQLDILKEYRKRLQKLCQENVTVLRQYLQRYDDIMLRIEQASDRRRKQFDEERERIKEQYRSIYHENIKQHTDFINTIDTASDEQWQTFLKEKVIKNNQLQVRLDKMQKDFCRDIAEEFDVLQKGCYVGHYQPDTVIFHDFGREVEKYNHHFGSMQKSVERMLREAGGMNMGKSADSGEKRPGKLGSGENSLRKKVNSLITRWTMTPMERTGKLVDAILDDICEQYEVDGFLKECESFCQELCMGSMKEVCAPRDIVEELCMRMKDMPMETSGKDVKKIGLAELLVSDVK